MYLDVEKRERKIELGDIFITTDDRIRMIIEDDYRYCVITLGGTVSSCWYDDIDELLSNYSIKEFYKNEDLKIVKEEN